MAIEFDTSKFEKFADEMAMKFPEYALEAAEVGLTEMGNYLLGLVPEYPEETLGRIMPPDGVSWLRTDKQRRWFFASVRKGTLSGWKWTDGHPEKVGGGRTGNLGRAKGMDIENDGASVVAILGFDPAIAPYAPWVVGDTYPGEDVNGVSMYQAKIHVDRWWQFGSIIEEGLDAGWQQFDAVFWEEFSKRINQNG